MTPEHLHLLARWAHHQPDQYNAWVDRSQGLNQRQAQAELLLTLLEAIAASNAQINLRPSRPSFQQEWQAFQPGGICKRSADPAIALLMAYVQWLDRQIEAAAEVQSQWS